MTTCRPRGVTATTAGVLSGSSRGSSGKTRWAMAIRYVRIGRGAPPARCVGFVRQTSFPTPQMTHAMYLSAIACRDVVGQVVNYEERFYGEAISRRMPENGAAEGVWCCWFLGVWRANPAFCWAGLMPGGFGWRHRRLWPPPRS